MATSSQGLVLLSLPQKGAVSISPRVKGPWWNWGWWLEDRTGQDRTGSNLVGGHVLVQVLQLGHHARLEGVELLHGSQVNWSCLMQPVTTAGAHLHLVSPAGVGLGVAEHWLLGEAGGTTNKYRQS